MKMPLKANRGQVSISFEKGMGCSHANRVLSRCYSFGAKDYYSMNNEERYWCKMNDIYYSLNKSYRYK